MADNMQKTGAALTFIEAADQTKVDFSKGNLIVQDTGDVYYDPTTGTSIESRIKLKGALDGQGGILNSDLTMGGTSVIHQSAAPSADDVLTNKKYVDDSLVAEITNLENGTTTLPYVSKNGSTEFTTPSIQWSKLDSLLISSEGFNSTTLSGGGVQFDISRSLLNVLRSDNGTISSMLNISPTDISSYQGGTTLYSGWKFDLNEISSIASSSGALSSVNVGEPTKTTHAATKNYVDSIVSAVYKPKGTIASSALTSTLLIKANLGNVYDVTDSFTATADFVDYDASNPKTYPANTNVAIVDVGNNTYKFDALAGFVDLSEYVTKDELSNIEGSFVSSTGDTSFTASTINFNDLSHLILNSKTGSISAKIDFNSSNGSITVYRISGSTPIYTMRYSYDGIQALNSSGNVAGGLGIGTSELVAYTTSPSNLNHIKLADPLSDDHAATKRYADSTAKTTLSTFRTQVVKLQFTTSSTWTQNSTTGIYSQTVNVSGLTSPMVDGITFANVVLDYTNPTTAKSQQQAMSCISGITTSSGSVELVCFDSPPDITITIELSIIYMPPIVNSGGGGN